MYERVGGWQFIPERISLGNSTGVFERIRPVNIQIQFTFIDICLKEKKEAFPKAQKLEAFHSFQTDCLLSQQVTKIMFLKYI